MGDADRRVLTRRALAAFAAAAGVLAVAAAGGVAAHLAARGTSTPVAAGHPHNTVSTQPQPAATAGTRSFGFAGVALAVPTAWPVEMPPCGHPRDPFIVFVTGAVYHCPRSSPGGTPTPAVLTIGTAATLHVPDQEWTSRTSRSAVRFEQTRIDCSTTAGVCFQVFRVPGTDTVFSLAVVPRERRLLATIPASLSRLPSGQAAVPWIDPGTVLQEADDLMRGAGLTPAADSTDGQHLVAMSSHPAAGSIVPSGSTVTLHVESYRTETSASPPVQH